MLDDFAESRKRLDAAKRSIDRALAIFECTEPGGGTLMMGGHCAACCYGTGYVVTCWEEDELVAALSEASAALTRYGVTDGS